MSERIGKLRAGLAAAGVEAFFSVAPSDNAYLSGFHGSTSAVLVTAQEAFFFCDFRYTEQATAQVSGMQVEEVAGGLELRVGQCLQTLGVASCGFDPTRLTVQQWDKVRGVYSGELVTLDTLMPQLRWIKSPEEVASIRKASNVAEAALAEVVADLAPGQTECEVAARLEYEFRLRGASGVSFDAIVLFGARSSLPHGAPGDTPLREGDIVLIDCGCVVGGYCSDLTRTYVYGRMPGAWFQEIYQVTMSAQEAALVAVRPGAVASAVDKVARDQIDTAGYGSFFGHGLGHGVGLEVHEAPRLNKLSDTVLQPGMVVTVEPGIYLPARGGVRIEDLVVVTTDGCEVLTATGKALEVLSK